MGKVIFITGGARSGKSSFALEKGRELGGRKAFIATMQAFDDETAKRIKMHREARGPEWETFEEPTEVVSLLNRLEGDFDTVVLDCLTLWLSNLMLSSQNIEEATAGLAKALKNNRMAGGVVLVSNEVGMGIVPENRLAREFRDMAGVLNRAVADIADEAYLMVSGMSICIKPGGGK